MPEGECCPQCLPDPCAGILCVAPVCLPESGEVPFLHNGECCARCVPLEEACATIECEPEQECQLVLGEPRCVPKIIDRSPCALIDCFGICQVVNGKAVCISSSDSPVLINQ